MRDNINKLVALAIGISVMSGSIIPAFAADDTQITYTSTNTQGQADQKTVLTLDDAIKGAISISETLALDDKKINYQDKTNDINEELDDYNGVDGDVEDFNNDTREINLKKLKQQRDFDEDVLRHKVTEKYSNILISQIEINKAAKELEIKNKEFENTKLKESLGMITTTDLKSTELEIQNKQNTQKANQNKLKDLEYSFKVLTGKDVSHYTLEKDIAHETLKIDGSIDEYLDNVIDDYLKYSEQLIKLNKDYYNDKDNYIASSGQEYQISDLSASELDDKKEEAEEAESEYKEAEKNKDNPEDPDAETNYQEKKEAYNKARSAYTGAIAARLTYLNTKLGVEKDQTSLNENKKAFKEQLKSYYTNLVAEEDTINYLKQNILLNNKKLSNAKLKYDLGIITESSYKSQVISSEDLELQLRDAIDTYNTLKENIQKPWIAFSNS